MNTPSKILCAVLVSEITYRVWALSRHRKEGEACLRYRVALHNKISLLRASRVTYHTNRAFIPSVTWNSSPTTIVTWGGYTAGGGGWYTNPPTGGPTGGKNS